MCFILPPLFQLMFTLGRTETWRKRPFWLLGKIFLPPTKFNFLLKAPIAMLVSFFPMFFFQLTKNLKEKKIDFFFISDGVSTKMHQNNVYTVAKRTLEGQDMVYQSIKFTNNVWALCELKLSPGSNVISVI